MGGSLPRFPTSHMLTTQFATCSVQSTPSGNGRQKRIEMGGKHTSQFGMNQPTQLLLPVSLQSTVLLHLVQQFEMTITPIWTSQWLMHLWHLQGAMILSWPPTADRFCLRRCSNRR